MKQTVNINVNHLTRVEGHGNIVVNVNSGKLEKCEWQVPETPRFFEAMVRGRHYTEIQRITSRICGICSVGHTLAAVKATENALAIDITPQTYKLRSILKHAENFDSHILHIYFLAAPDLLGVKSVFPLVSTHDEVVKCALRLKRLGHEWGALLAGRTTHPTKVLPGGFSKVPDAVALAQLQSKLLAAVPDLQATLETILSVADKIPDFHRPTEYIALSNDNDYAVYDGVIQSVLANGEKQRYPLSQYRNVANEYVSPLSTAKYARNKLDSYAVGAMARFNNNYEQLHVKAQAAAKRLGIEPICDNPYMNTIAQLVEVFHSVYSTLDIIDELLSSGIKPEPLVLPARYASGVGAVEVPRGILFHEFEFDEKGICTAGNCVIPTNQNHANIQKDFDALVPELLAQDKDEKQMELALEMLVRSYDPCISCSTHFLDVKFVK